MTYWHVRTASPPASHERGTASGDPGLLGAALHRFRSGQGEHVLVVPFSRIYDLDADFSRRIDRDDHDALGLMTALSTPGGGEVPLSRVPLPAPQSISLNVSSSCNLGCAYCYASRGGFGGAQTTVMSWEIARQAVEKLIAGSDAKGPVTIGFLGGEPFVNRRLIHRVVAHARRLSLTHRRDVRFSVTTNGTLLRDSDIRLLRDHAFAVTVSIDGGAAIQNARRPLARGTRGTPAVSSCCGSTSGRCWQSLGTAKSPRGPRCCRENRT